MRLSGRQKQKKQASTSCADFSLARPTEPNTAASLSSNRIDRIAQSSCISTCLEPFRLLSFSISATNETTGPVRLVPKSGGPEITQQSTVETRPSMARTSRSSATVDRYHHYPTAPCMYLAWVNSHPAMVAQRIVDTSGLPSW